MSFDLNFNLIADYYKEVINYCGKYSETFSIITMLKKPYSKIPPNCKHSAVLEPFHPYLIKQIIGVLEWPGTVIKGTNKMILNMYSCCRDTRTLLAELPNMFFPLENNLPEDICFYRDKKPWFVTISHEKIAYLTSSTKQDDLFFRDFIRKY